MQKTHYFLFLFLYLSLKVGAQTPNIDRSKYALLWEITGKELTEPSYIFGTFHVRDKVVFDFPDSFFVALLACDAFANEVHLDSTMLKEIQYSMQDSLMRKKIFQQNNKEKNPPPSLPSEKSEPPNRQKQAKKTKEKKGILNPEKEGMPTFLDAYLMNIAKKEGKILYGLESIDDHLAIAKTLETDPWEEEQNDDEYDFFSIFKKTWYEEALDIYLKGDMKEMEAAFLSSTSDDPLKMVKRNYDMADAIERITKTHSLFSCVGAGHLPGKEGVIKILEKRGYTLRPVTADFTGLAQIFIPKSENLAWVTTTSEYSDLQFQTPQQALKIPMPGNLFDVYLSLDIGNGLFYYTYAFDRGTIEAESYYDTLKQNFLIKQGMFVFEEKTIEKQGLIGREYFSSKPSSALPYNRIQCFIKKDKLYILMLGAYEKYQLASQPAERYFASLKIFEAKYLGWSLHQDSLGAYSVNMPAQLRPIRNEVPNPIYPDASPYVINAYLGSDTESGKAYVMRYSDFPSGLILENDTTFFDSAVESISSSLKVNILDEKDIQLNGYPGRAYPLENEKINGEMLVYLRGNRAYILLELGETTVKKGDFLTSFKMEPFPPMEQLQPKTLLDGALTAHLPADVYETVNTDLQYIIPEATGEYLYYSSEINTGTVFGVECLAYSPYYEVHHLDTALVQFMEEILEVGDSLYNIQDTLFQGAYPAKFFQIKNPYNNVQSQYLLFVRYNVLYLFSVYYAYELAGNPTIAEFFNTIKFTGKDVHQGDLLASKAGLIFQDIQSTDSLTLEKVKDALSFYAFKPTDLPQLYQLLEQNYPDDTLNWNSVKLLLLDELVQANDEQTIPFLKQFYDATESAILKNKVLLVLSQIGTEESWTAMFKLTNSPRSQKIDLINVFQILRPFSDSLALFEKYYPDLTQWSEKQMDAYQYFSFSTRVIKDSLIDKTFILRNLETYENLVDTVISQLKKGKDQEVDAFGMRHIVQFYQTIPVTPKRISQLKQMYPYMQDWVKIIILAYFFEHGAPVEKIWVENLLQDSTHYYPMLEILQTHQRLDYATKAQLKQPYIAEGMLRHYIIEEEGYTPKLEYLSTKEVLYQGKKVRVYVFYHFYKNGEEGPPNKYIGLAGAFPLNKKDYSFNADLCDFSYIAVTKDDVEKEIQRILDILLTP